MLACNVSSGAQRSLVERLVEKTIHEPTTNLDLPATLYSCAPNGLKEQPLESTNLLLVLDAGAAQYPWEMLAERQLGTASAGSEPLQPWPCAMAWCANWKRAVFATRCNRRAARMPWWSENRWSMIRPIPHAGARAEAEAVANVLESFGYDVTRCIQADALTIINALYAKEYRIIHIAGHGIYQPEYPAQSGVVLGNNIYLTAAEIGQLRVVPEMVFLNCCHLGVIDADTMTKQSGRHQASAPGTNGGQRFREADRNRCACGGGGRMGRQ